MTRARLLVLGKLIVGVGLIVWLVRQGSLDLAALSVFFERPSLLVANLTVLAGTNLLAALRWRLVLRATGVDLSFPRAVQLTLVGMFFNVVAPGNIGGDVLKAVYVARDVAPELRPGVYLAGVLDRALALAGLVIVAAVLTASTRGGAWATPPAQELTAAIAILALATAGAPVVALIVVRRYATRLRGWNRSESRLARALARLVDTIQIVAGNPGRVLVGLAAAIAIHLVGIAWFAMLATAVTDQRVTVSSMAAVYPVGMLSVLLPISYAGFGVGHVAFDRLFAMVGLHGGATALNTYLVGTTVPCLLGVIPYALLKRRAPPPAAVVVEP